MYYYRLVSQYKTFQVQDEICFNFAYMAKAPTPQRSCYCIHSIKICYIVLPFGDTTLALDAQCSLNQSSKIFSLCLNQYFQLNTFWGALILSTSWQHQELTVATQRLNLIQTMSCFIISKKEIIQNGITMSLIFMYTVHTAYHPAFPSTTW